jgi:hypothetical protein
MNFIVVRLRETADLQVLWVLSRKLDSCWVNVLSNAAHVVVGSNTSSVNLLRVDTILRVQVLNLSVWEDPVDAAVNLELSAELGQESKALLLSCKLQQVASLPHNSRSSSWHLEDLLLLGLPRNDVELLNLSLPQQST